MDTLSKKQKIFSDSNNIHELYEQLYDNSHYNNRSKIRDITLNYEERVGIVFVETNHYKIVNMNEDIGAFKNKIEEDMDIDPAVINVHTVNVRCSAQVEKIMHLLLSGYLRHRFVNLILGEWFFIEGNHELILNNLLKLIEHVNKMCNPDNNSEEKMECCSIESTDLNYSNSDDLFL